MVKVKQIRQKIVSNRFRTYEYVEPLPEAPFKFLETIEKLYARYPQFNKFEEFEKTIVDFDLTLADFNITVASDECNDYIEAEVGILGLYSVKYKFYRRKLKCRIRSPQSIPPKDEYEFSPPISPQCGDGRQIYIWHLKEKIFYRDQLSLESSVALEWEHEITSSKIIKVEFPNDEYGEYDDGTPYQIYAKIHTEQKYYYKSNYDASNTGREFGYQENLKRSYVYEFIYPRGARNRSNLGSFSDEGYRFTSGWASSNYDYFVDENYREKSFRRIFNGDGIPRPLVSYDYGQGSTSTESPYRIGTRIFIRQEPDIFGLPVKYWESNIENI
ncbi:MAG: hypothetical protein HC907_29750 [Richelia sp. SM1_7_0]|nr:hypothetical protein [Richelia sp. SM1_7_0]